MVQSGQNAEMASEALALFKSTDAMLGGFGSLGRVEAGDSNVESVVKSYRGEGKDLDIGFWNIEFLNKHYENKVDQVADLIVQMNLDVWCISESSPKAAAVLTERLNKHYGVPFKSIASEPNAPTTKLSNTVLYNSKTVHVEKRDWPRKVENLLQASSKDDLNLESVHGKIFDRYPAWYTVTFLENPDLKVNVVPLHLKALGEGVLRRRLASKILAKAVEISIKEDTSGLAKNGWLLGGDLNATLASKDFDSLSDSGFIPLSAKDSLDQAGFSYLKSPYKNLIDHVFMSPGLSSMLDEDDFFIVAADLSLSNFLKISDHRPVLVRMSLAPEARPEAVEADVLSKLLIEAESMPDETQDLLLPVVENRRRTYYDREADQRQLEAYYTGVSLEGDSNTLRSQLEALLVSTHTIKLGYDPKVHLYPWVDWRPNGKCESIYSGKSFDPEELIKADLETEAKLESAIREAVLKDNFSLESISESLESQYTLNCEHVVPQSWFQKLQPMKGDLHHLFSCEPSCNSFRGNFRYVDFDDFEAIRDDCGRSERATFEPKSGKGPVARATLYFLLRYPGRIDSFYSNADISMLVAWSENDPVGEYERHRNWAIQEVQGNRNPFIDFPGLASKLFTP